MRKKIMMFVIVCCALFTFVSCEYVDKALDKHITKLEVKLVKLQMLNMSLEVDSYRDNHGVYPQAHVFSTFDEETGEYKWTQHPSYKLTEDDFSDCFSFEITKGGDEFEVIATPNPKDQYVKDISPVILNTDGKITGGKIKKNE